MDCVRAEWTKIGWKGTYSAAEGAVVAVVNDAVRTGRATSVAGRRGLEGVLLVRTVAVVREVET